MLNSGGNGLVIWKRPNDNGKGNFIRRKLFFQFGMVAKKYFTLSSYHEMQQSILESTIND